MKCGALRRIFMQKIAPKDRDVKLYVITRDHFLFLLATATAAHARITGAAASAIPVLG